jgi:hypothetical protein
VAVACAICAAKDFRSCSICFFFFCTSVENKDLERENGVLLCLFRR